MAIAVAIALVAVLVVVVIMVLEAVMVVMIVVVVVVAAAGARAFSRFLPQEPVGGYTEVQKARQAWTSLDFGQASSGQDGAMRRTAPAWGLAQFGREVFCPWRPLEVIEPSQARSTTRHP